MAAGSITTVRGRGCRAVSTTGSEAGGGPRSSPSSISTSHSATTSVGIRCRTTSAIHIRDITDATIRAMAGGAMAEEVAGVMPVVDATVVGDRAVVMVATVTTRHGAA